MKRLEKRYINPVIDLILSRPRTWLAITGVLVIFALIPAWNIEADFDLEGFYPEDSETIVEYQRIAREFGRDDNMVIIAFRHDSLFTPAHLLQIRRMADDLGTLPYIEEVRSLWTIQEFTSDNGSLNARPYLDEEIVVSKLGIDEPGQATDDNSKSPASDDNSKSPASDDNSNSVASDDNSNSALSYAKSRNLEAKLSKDTARLENIRDRMLEDPFVNGTYLGSGGTATALFLRIDDEKNTFTNRRELLSRMDELLEPYRAQYELNVSGLPYFRTRYVETLNREILFYVSIASLMIIIILWLLFRTILGVILPISIVWLTILFVTAILVMTGGYFEILSSTIAPILLCVGVADSVHMLSKYQDLRLQNKSRDESLQQMILVLGTATLLTSVTTAIGFLTLMTSDVMPMRRFGIYTAAGVLIAFLITVFILPSVLKLLRNRTPVEDKSRIFFRKVGSVLSSTHRTARRHPRKVVVTTLLVTMVFSIGITQLRTNSRVFDDIGENSELIRQSRFLDKYLAPQFPLEIIVDTGQEDGVYDPDLLKRIQKLQDHLVTYDEVEQSISFATLLSRVDRVMRGSPDGTLPDSRPLIAQYDLLLEMTGGTAVSGLNDFENRQTRIIARAYDAGSYRINLMRKDLESYLDELFPGESVMLTGSTILSADLTGNIVRALTWSIGLAFLFISVIMALLFRNAKLVLISLLPNLIPLLITAGFMGFAGIDIRPSTAVIFTIAFGIAVDDSIHYLARFRMETLRGSPLHTAVKNTTIHTGRAIVLTSLILLVGFGVLGTSSFESNMLMGLLTCLTIFTALVADLLFLPALIYWMNPKITIGEVSSQDGLLSPRTSPRPSVTNQIQQSVPRGQQEHQIQH